jgi:hypothetical protein
MISAVFFLFLEDNQTLSLMKRNTLKKLSLGKIKIASLSHAHQNAVKGGATQKATVIMQCPTYHPGLCPSAYPECVTYLTCGN